MLVRFTLLSSLTLALLSSAARSQLGAVHVVVEGMDLQAAVDAAQSGDTLLIYPGVYPSGAVIDGKSLTLAAEGSVPPLLLHGVQVANLAASGQVVLSGLQVQGEPWTGAGSGNALSVSNSAGAVRVDRCQFLGRERGHGATLIGALSFAATDSVFRGGNAAVWAPVAPGSGLWSSGSWVALYQSQLRGASGLEPTTIADGQPGADGGVISGGLLHFAESTFRGGDGGAAFGTCMFGGNGGDGLVVQTPSNARAIASTFVRGDGGAGGGCFCTLCVQGNKGTNLVGPVQLLAGPTTELELPRVAREATVVNVTVMTQPGAQGFLLASQQPAHALDAAYNGPLLLKGPFEVRTSTGPIPSGSTTISLTLPSLPAGVQSQTWFVQTIVRAPGGGGAFAGECRPLVIVDDAF